MTMRVFVAGATGVLGRRVVPLLVAGGHDVTANVRDESGRQSVQAAGARARTVDLLNSHDTDELTDDHDAVVNIATSIPTGASAVRRSAWALNDRLRSEASANLAASMSMRQGRYVGESLTFPYTDTGDDWIDEAHPRSYFWGNRTCIDAEASVDAVTQAGGIGVALRFAMFFADDSAHVDSIRTAARFGLFALPGRRDGRISFIHVDDAATAVVAALSAPAGRYNVAEADPSRWAEHAESLATCVGRRRLRGLPAAAVRFGGPSMESLARSQRISSRALTAATGWTAVRNVVDHWAPGPSSV